MLIGAGNVWWAWRPFIVFDYHVSAWETQSFQIHEYAFTLYFFPLEMDRDAFSVAA